MATATLQFGNNQESGDHTLAGASPLAINVLIDGRGAVRRRPGISAWDGFPTAIPVASQVDGIASFGGDVYWVNEARHVYRLAPVTATTTDLSSALGNSLVDGSGRPVFAQSAFRLVIAGGQDIQEVESGAAAATRLGGSPPIASHVIALASRLFCNDVDPTLTSRGKIRASGIGNAGEESWDELDIVSAEARPDNVVALAENSNEAFAWGESTLQVFSPDGNFLLAPGRALNRGIAAAHSVIRKDEDFAWLSNERVFTVSDGRGVAEISDPIAATLDNIETVSDCWGFRYNEDQFDCLVWPFPTDGRTFAQQVGGGWSQWHGWNGSGHTLFPVTAHHYFASQNVHLVGLESGQIAKLDTTASTDLGATIKAEVRTGHQSRGTLAYKHCEILRLIFERGATASTTTEPQVLLSWRDDLGAYCDPLRLGLGVSNERIFTIEVRSLGTYRSRDWKLEFTDASTYVLARVEETYTVEDA